MRLWIFTSLQEKQTIKVKEKLDKCVKEKLLEFCDVLDVPIAKANARKVCWFLIYVYGLGGFSISKMSLSFSIGKINNI